MAVDREEACRRAFEAFAARDLPRLTELVAPDFELRPLVSVWQRSFRGIEGLEEWFAEVSRTWAEFTIEEDEIREIDADRMLIRGHWRGCAVAGGNEVGGPSAALITFRDDEVVLADFFLSEEAALASLESAG